MNEQLDVMFVDEIGERRSDRAALSEVHLIDCRL